MSASVVDTSCIHREGGSETVEVTSKISTSNESWSCWDIVHELIKEVEDGRGEFMKRFIYN